MGLSVLEAANAGVKYLDSNRTPGSIDCVAFTHSSMTYVLSPSPDLSGAFIPVHAFRPQTS
jgi:hypothetical protein